MYLPTLFNKNGNFVKPALCSRCFQIQGGHPVLRSFRNTVMANQAVWVKTLLWYGSDGDDLLSHCFNSPGIEKKVVLNKKSYRTWYKNLILGCNWLFVIARTSSKYNPIDVWIIWHWSTQARLHIHTFRVVIAVRLEVAMVVVSNKC